MPLANSEALLATELKSAMKNVAGYDAAWDKMAEIVIKHIVKNALVTGVCPSGGGTLTLGKLQ